MNEKKIFMPLFKHEFSLWHSHRIAGGRLSKGWWVVYIAVFLMLFFGFTTWAALNGAIQLSGTWYITFALPFMLFFFGYRAVMREFKSNTAGWWLTLPYSRTQLILAKFTSGWLKAVLLIAATYFVIVLFGSFVTLIQARYGLSDLLNFMITGLNWYFIIFAFSPFAVSLGVFTATLRYTALKPLIPVGFLIYYLTGDLLFIVLGFSGDEIYRQFSGEIPAEWFPYAPAVFLPFIAGWIVSYLLIRGSSYLFSKKVTM
ncbi:MAG TPA: ABC transporter permease [Bacillales bacterium]|nr:ABC transporter permease [Bacillales bacterium]